MNSKQSPNTCKAWKRTLQKYSPSKQCDISPIKPTCGNLQPVKVGKKSPFYLENRYILGLCYMLNLSEMYYYDNSLLMLHQYQNQPENTAKVIRANASLQFSENIGNNWENIHQLGSGSFGAVYKVHVKNSDLSYALKYVFPDFNDDVEQQFITLISYLTERNFLIRSRKSPFAIQFIQSFLVPEVPGRFLLFELCLGDLGRFFRIYGNIGRFDHFDLLLNKNNDKQFDLNREIELQQDKLNVSDLKSVLVIHLYECLCILDYLAKCNIVHRDIKPENIMIAQNMHLKLADFGLCYQVSFLENDDNQVMVKQSKIDKTLSSRAESKMYPIGTYFYIDAENKYLRLKRSSSTNPEFVLSPLNWIPGFDPKDAKHCFLSDIYSMGLTMLECLLLNTNYLISEKADGDYLIKKMLDIPIDITDVDDIISYILIRSDLFTELFVEGTRSLYVGSGFENLVEFLLTMLLPRVSRCKGYLLEKPFRRTNNIVNTKYLNMSKINEIDIFKINNLNENNVFLIDIDKRVHEIVLGSLKSPKGLEIYEDFEELVLELKASKEIKDYVSCGSDETSSSKYTSENVKSCPLNRSSQKREIRNVRFISLPELSSCDQDINDTIRSIDYAEEEVVGGERYAEDEEEDERKYSFNDFVDYTNQEEDVDGEVVEKEYDDENYAEDEEEYKRKYSYNDFVDDTNQEEDVEREDGDEEGCDEEDSDEEGCDDEDSDDEDGDEEDSDEEEDSVKSDDNELDSSDESFEEGDSIKESYCLRPGINLNFL